MSRLTFIITTQIGTYRACYKGVIAIATNLGEDEVEDGEKNHHLMRKSMDVIMDVCDER